MVFAGDAVGKLASWRKSMSSCSEVQTGQAYPGLGQPSAGGHGVTGRTRGAMQDAREKEIGVVEDFVSSQWRVLGRFEY